MLDPTKRHSFFDLLAPPPGYVLESGFGTTYSAQFEVLTAATLALLGEETEDLARMDIIAALHAIARLKDRFRLFVHQGGFSHESVSRAERLFALYDRFVRPVPLEGGAFHPKTWVLKFIPRQTPELRDAEPEYRVLCMSRNLTGSHCWELGIALTGRRSERVSEPGQSLGRFALRLAEADPSGMAALSALARELPRIEFQASREGREAVDFHWQWPGESSRGALLKHLPAKAERALVLSPFVRAEIVERLARYDQLTLVALQPELDRLPDSVYENLRTRGHELLILEPPEVPSEETLTGGLHAKLYVLEHGGASTTLVGSANATSAAWGAFALSNVETVLALSPGISLERARRDLIAKEKDVHHPWIQEYRRQKPSDDPREDAERELDLVARALATAHLEIAYSSKLRRLDLRLVERQPILENGQEIRVELAPYLLLRSGRSDLWRPLDEAKEGCEYQGVEERDASAFVFVRLSHPTEATVERLFTFQATNLRNGPVGEGRDEALVRQIVEESRLDPLSLLSRLLGRRPPPPGGESRKGDGKHRDPTSPERPSILDDFSIESILERCTDDESSISEVDAFLSTFGPKLDPAFSNFWSTFKDALRRHGGRP